MSKLEQAQAIVRLSTLRSELSKKSIKALQKASEEVTIENIDEARFLLIELNLISKELQEKLERY